MTRHDDRDSFLESDEDDEALLDSLRSLHHAPLPSPEFVASLRGDLMAEATPIHPTAPVDIPRAKGFQQMAAPLPAPTPWNRSRSRRWVSFELAAVAALLLAILGTALTGGPNGFLSAIRQSSDDSGGPTALFRGDNARTGIMPEAGPTELPSVIWRKPLTNPNLWPVIANRDRVYMVDADGGTIQSVSTHSGMPIWGASVGRMSVPASIAVANGTVYALTGGPLMGGSDKGYLVALDESDGQERWRYETGGASVSSPAIDDGFVYVLALDNSLRAVDAKTGAEAWRYDIPSGSLSPSAMATAMAEGTPVFPMPNANVNNVLSNFSPAISNGMIYVTANDGVLYAINLKTRQEAWHFASDGNMLATPAIANGVVYLPGWGASEYEDAQGTSPRDVPDGRLYALDAETGASRWQWSGADFVSIVAVTDQSLYLTNDGSLIALSASDGASQWSVAAGFDAPVYANGIIYLLDQRGTVNAYAADSGKPIWNIYTAGRMPLTANGMIVMRDARNQLVALGQVSAATPGASPVTDLSGLPACTAPAPKPSLTLEGTPTASLVPVRDGQDHGQPAQVLLSEIPEGTPVTAEVEGEVVQTLRQIVNCLPPGRADDLSGFLSDDFLRRAWVQAFLELNPGYAGSYLPTSSEYDNMRLLPDGRVGVLSMTSDLWGTFTIFVKDGDHWVMDERLEVVQQLGGMG